MNTFLWLLQAVVALHTAAGAVWKISNPVQAVPSLGAIPPAVWLGLGAAELVCSVALLLPAARRPLAKWIPVAAGLIAAEMVLFSVLHFAGGARDAGPVVYWLVVAGVCGLLAYGRRVLRPL